MCDRFSLGETTRVGQLFNLPNWPETSPRCNIVPRQEVPAVIQNRETGAREFQPFRWNLVPSWATDPAIGNRMINARSETVATKPTFRKPLRERRCLILADGFYEWKREGPRKFPFVRFTGRRQVLPIVRRDRLGDLCARHALVIRALNTIAPRESVGSGEPLANLWL